MVLMRLSWKDFRSRPLRTLLTLFSIVIGVSAVVAIALAVENTRNAQKSMLKAVSGRASLEIHREGNTAFEASILENVRQVPKVRLATGMIRRNSVMFFKTSRKVSVQYLGVDPTLDSTFREYRLVEGQPLGDDDRVLMDRGFAKSLGLKLDDKVKFQTSSGTRETSIAGFIEPESGSTALQAGLIVLRIDVAQVWARSKGRLDAIQVLADEKTNADELTSQIQAILPEGLRVKIPSLRNELGNEATVIMEQGLRLASAFSLVLAIFIIYNTFQMNVGERRRQFGILRALGTTRSQIVRMILKEGLILGIAGTLFGWILGYFASYGLLIATGNLIDVASGNLRLTWFPFALSGGIGLVVSLFGALFPALRAARLSPAEAMRVVSSGELEPSHRMLLWLGAILSSIGLTIVILCISGVIHINHSVPGCFLILLGSVVALPTFLEQATRWVLRSLGGLLGIEGRLAQRQILRNGGRSSLTIGILFIALSVGLGLACIILDNMRDVRRWSEETLLGDFFVRATMPSLATGQAADVPAGLVETIRAIDGVQTVETLRFVSAQSGDFSVIVVAREFSVYGRKFFDIAHGKPNEIFEGLERGGVVIGSVLAERSKLKLGDELPLDTLSGAVALPIVGVANDYMAAGLTVYMNRKQAEELFEIEGHDAIVIDTIVGQGGEVESVLRALCEPDGLLLQTQTELLRFVQSKVDGVVSSLWALLAVGSLIAAFGLVNTLTMNILEQTSEIGMLRVVAMTRNQVRKMILSQALMMGIIGLIPAVFAGLFIAYLLSLSTLPTTGHAVTFVFRPWLTLGTFVADLIVVVLASLIPAERAARIPVAKAMQFQ